MQQSSDKELAKRVKEARLRLWQRGDLVWKLDPTQRKLYDFFKANASKTVVVNASRRLGKSFFLIILALELCIQKPGAIVKYIQPETGMIRKNLNPDFEQMIQDCPLELRPRFMTQDNMWVFPNGSKIHLAGTDGKNYDKLRGGNADLCLVDEAGFCNDLKHIINSILTPLTTLTKGRIVLSSTTSTDPDHEFNEYMDAAEANNNLIRKTILDAVDDHKDELYPRITKEVVAGIVASYPKGMEDQSFRTEYLCEKVFNSTDSVLPEFSQEVQDDIIVEWPKPPFYDRYVSMDIGFKDLTVVLFAYWDFVNRVLVIEDEIVESGGPGFTTSILAKMVKDREAKLWTNPTTGELSEVYKRVSDNNLQVINDLAVDHKLYFLATEKHEKFTYINNLREMIEHREIKINPRCKTLITHMRGASWDKHKKDFKRNTTLGHHYDAVAALLYLSRNIEKNRNPFPSGYKYSLLGDSNNVHIRESGLKQQHQNAEYNKIKEMFARKSSYHRKNNK